MYIDRQTDRQIDRWIDGWMDISICIYIYMDWKYIYIYIYGLDIYIYIYGLDIYIYIWIHIYMWIYIYIYTNILYIDILYGYVCIYIYRTYSGVKVKQLVTGVFQPVSMDPQGSPVTHRTRSGLTSSGVPWIQSLQSRLDALMTKDEDILY